MLYNLVGLKEEVVKMSVRIAPNPFTPKSGMEPRFFAGRDKEINLFHKKLTEAKHKRYDHFCILGEWGIGKTALLKEFKKISQTKKIPATYVSIREFQEGDKFLNATEHLITYIPRSLPLRFEALTNFKNFLSGVGITFPFIGGGVELKEKQLSGDPQVLLLDALVRLWRDLKQETDVVVVLLDDVQNYKPISGFLTILKNVLSDDEIQKNTGYLFILTSTNTGWEEFLKRHHPIGRFFTPVVTLHNLSEEETISLVERSLESTGVTISKSILKKVYEYTEGHPYELQILCSYLYENQIGRKINARSWDTSLNLTLEYLGQILLATLIQGTSQREQQLLKVLASSDSPLEWKTITSLIKGTYKTFPAQSVGKFLSRLLEKGLIQQPKRGIYKLPDRMFREYILRLE